MAIFTALAGAFAARVHIERKNLFLQRK